MTRWLVGWALVVAVGAGCAPPVADLKPTLAATDAGGLWFASAGSLVRSGLRLVPGDTIAISGDLDFPSGAGPFPAVILAHGCGGIGVVQTAWAQVLRQWGYATFVVDSFRGRGLAEVCTSAATLTGIQRIPDAYGALRVLATHPRIDARRIALMGFSHGGSLTLGASTVWARDMYATAGQPSFRAFVAFYPSCNVIYPERERVSAPLRIHSGDVDDWTPAAPCIELAQLLKAAGQDATITVYAGSHHGFDAIGRGYVRLPNVESGAACTLRAASILGPLLSLSELRSCRRKGATIAWNPDATEQARRNVRAQLAELLALLN